MGNPLTKPASLISKSISNTGNDFNQITRQATARLHQSTDRADATMSSVNEATAAVKNAVSASMSSINDTTAAVKTAIDRVEGLTGSAQVTIGKAGEASDAVASVANKASAMVEQLAPQLTTATQQATSTMSTIQNSVRDITPYAISTTETVQTCINELTPAAAGTLRSVQQTSDVFTQAIPAVVQSAQVVAASAATNALAGVNVARSLNSVANSLVQQVAAAEAAAVVMAARASPAVAKGFLKCQPKFRYGVFIAFNDDAYHVCRDQLPKELSSRVYRSLAEAIESVAKMRRGLDPVLPDEIEVVFHRHAMVDTVDKDIIAMPDVGRFILCGSTNLSNQPRITLRGVICDLDANGCPMGRVQNLNWQPGADISTGALLGAMSGGFAQFMAIKTAKMGVMRLVTGTCVASVGVGYMVLITGGTASFAACIGAYKIYSDLQAIRQRLFHGGRPLPNVIDLHTSFLSLH